jgi:hypothetical protein
MVGIGDSSSFRRRKRVYVQASIGMKRMQEVGSMGDEAHSIVSCSSKRSSLRFHSLSATGNQACTSLSISSSHHGVRITRRWKYVRERKHHSDRIRLATYLLTTTPSRRNGPRARRYSSSESESEQQELESDSPYPQRLPPQSSLTRSPLRVRP